MKALGRIVLFIQFAVCFSSAAQNAWIRPGFEIQAFTPRVLYSDTKNDWLYIGGHIYQVNGLKANRIFRVNSSGYVDLMDTVTPASNKIVAIAEFNDTLYFAGANGLFTYQDSIWISEYGFNQSFDELAVYNNELLIGGTKTLLKYDGISFSDFGNLDSVFLDFYAIYTMAEYKNKLYVGGNFQDNPGNFNEIMSWDGTGWINMMGGIQGFSGWEGVSDLIVYKDELYVAGSFSKSTGSMSDNLLKWDGENWLTIGNGIYGDFGGAFEMFVFEDELWVVGLFDSVDGLGLSNVAIWNGEYWCRPKGEFYYENLCLTEFNDTLYMGGNFRSIDGDSSYKYLVKFNNSSERICQDLTTVNKLKQESENILLYPNPCNGRFYINNPYHEILQVDFLNLLGTKVYTVALKELSTTHIYLPENFCEGLYFLHYTNSEKEVKTEKLLLKR